MREFIRGWRRKTGCGLLVIAVFLGIAWGRSMVIMDELQLPRSTVISNEGRIYWISVRRHNAGRLPESRQRLRWKSEQTTDWKSADVWLAGDVIWMRQWCGFAFGSAVNGGYVIAISDTGERGEYRHDFWVVPYWAVILPFTLACLILWRPRKRQRTDRT
ncbi:MAG: hypothetical protein JSS49_24750 [Planctomycetes bacterium]|nr:hypothetical protein [Planctomycetota bacterium]